MCRAIEVLLQNSVAEDKIIVLTLFAAPEGTTISLV